MNLEPFAVAWPFLVAVAAAGGVRAARLRRRRVLNRALHELRRPLQALALAPGQAPGTRGDAPGALDLALAALEDLDAAVNGTRPRLSRRAVAARPLLEESLTRWRAVAARRERSLTLDWRAGQAVLWADPARVTQALDNLLANAIEHGGLRVRVTASVLPGRLRIVIATADSANGDRGGDPRRGHGLAVVTRIAQAHLGRFAMHRDGGRAEAVLELPLAAVPLPAAPIQWAVPPRSSRVSGRVSSPAGPRAA